MTLPYQNHMEHLQDIINLVQIRQNPERSDSLQSIITYIQDRESLSTDVFLPLVHLSKIYNLDESLKVFLYYIAALSITKTSTHPESILSTHSHFDFNQLEPLSELIDNFENYTLKQRVITFILEPFKVLKQSWLSFYYSECNLHIIPMERVYNSIIRLTDHYLSDSKSHIILIYGKNGSGRKSQLCHAAFTKKFSLLFIDMYQLLLYPDFKSLIQEIVLESKLMNCLLCFTNIDVILDSDHKGLFHFLLYELGQSFKLVFFIGEQEITYLSHNHSIVLTTIQIPDPDVNFSKILWKNSLSLQVFDQIPDLEYLSSKFTLTPFQISQCVYKTYTHSIVNNKEFLQKNKLYQICRDFCTKKLPLLGSTVLSTFSWDDLILPLTQKSLLQSIVHRITYHNLVFHQWGFEQKLPYAKGLCVLFEGPPGTGKTMAAGILANELDLPMYKVNLSSIMSKYIGETEKNLQAVFEEAHQINCILFFDEADSLFGKRTAVNDSKDRFANLEISFLLQKLEEYDGITILATNLIKNLDDAFKRRFHYIIRFPQPDEEHRKKLWKSMFPSELPVADNIDYDFLAHQFHLSGSSIKQITLSAAFTAAANGTTLEMKHIIQALKEDAEKNGIPLQPRDLGKHWI